MRDSGGAPRGSTAGRATAVISEGRSAGGAMDRPHTEDAVVDLFSGSGGWCTGLRQAGYEGEIVGIEKDENASATATAAGHCSIQADVTAFDPPELFDFGLAGMVASPPCQSWSMAGKGRGREQSQLILDALEQVETYSDIERVIDKLHHRMTDDRTLLVLQPLRWALALTPSWIAWEQVPAVLPLWEASAEVLRRIGYTVETANLQAEMFGVPQTRRRAILVAHAPWMLTPAKLPESTHSRYYSRDPQKLDPGVRKWVSMAEALGWGMTERPSMTVTGGGTGAGGAEPFGNGTRKGMTREREAGRWEGPVSLVPNRQPNATVRDIDHPAPTITAGHDSADRQWRFAGAGATSRQTAGQVPRDLDEPAHTVTGKGTAAWVVRTGVNSATVGPGEERDKLTAEGRWRECHKPQERSVGAPSPTVTSQTSGWKFGEVYRNGDPKARGRRVTVEEAAILQSFPRDYPWQGSKTAQYQQVGNAIPPLLAQVVATTCLEASRG